MKLKNLLTIINDFLPAQTAMDGDRIGLQIQGGREEAENILVTLEINDEVIDEAVKENCDCIITFHPLIFAPLTHITDEDRVGRLSSKIIKNSISLISIHTNFDAFSEGTSKILSDKLGFEVIDFLVPDKSFVNYGMGIISKPKKALKPDELLKSVQDVCCSPLRYSIGKTGKKISRIAIVGGSGTSFINEAVRSECDAFITADITYHKFHQVGGKLMLIDPGHYEMEQFVPAGLKKLLENKLEKKHYKFIKVSSILTNPVRYFPDYGQTKKQKEYLNHNKMV